MTYILLLTIWSADTPQPDVYVLQSGLTGEQCIAGMVDFKPMEDNGVGNLSCEFDHADT